MTRKSRNLAETAFFALWIVFLGAWSLLKLSSSVFGFPVFSDSVAVENRKLTPNPDYLKLDPKDWGRKTDEWYNDNFAFRAEVLSLYRRLHFKYLKSPVMDKVPGEGDWIFTRGGKWPEVEDYMGVIALDRDMVRDWVDLFEGRVAWAEAHGIKYLEVIPPMKSRIHPEKMPLMISLHKKDSYSEELERAIEGTAVSSNVLFLAEALEREVESGREVYYEEDHHENAYGCYCIFREINLRMRKLWYPDLPLFPFYDTPPEELLSGEIQGCHVKDRRLVVSNPGTRLLSDPHLQIDPKKDASVFPHCKILLGQPGEDRYILFCHDSYLRYPFDTWYCRDMRRFAMPVGSGFSKIGSFIFTRLTTERLEAYTRNDIPDVIVEQFSAGRLQYGPVGYDETMKRAARWGRGRELHDSHPEGGKVLAMAKFAGLSPLGGADEIKVVLKDAAGNVLAKCKAAPGVKRAVFLGDVVYRKDAAIGIEGGRADSAEILYRNP